LLHVQISFKTAIASDLKNVKVILYANITINKYDKCDNVCALALEHCIFCKYNIDTNPKRMTLMTLENIC